MGENAVLVHLFDHNLWANERMARACAGLTDAQLAIETTGPYGALSTTRAPGAVGG